jgi:hypothetical protein
LVSRKSVSTCQRLTLRKTTALRSASNSFVTMYSWLPREVSGHDQPQGTVLGSVEAHGCSAYSEALAPLQRQPPGQLAHAATLASPVDDRPRMERTDPRQAHPRERLGEPPGAVVGVEDNVASFEPRTEDLPLSMISASLSLVW